MDTKKWYLSKTEWFNVVTILVGIAALPEFLSILPEAWLPYIVFVNAAGNMYLRTITNQGISK